MTISNQLIFRHFKNSNLLEGLLKLKNNSKFYPLYIFGTNDEVYNKLDNDVCYHSNIYLLKKDCNFNISNYYPYIDFSFYLNKTAIGLREKVSENIFFPLFKLKSGKIFLLKERTLIYKPFNFNNIEEVENLYIELNESLYFIENNIIYISEKLLTSILDDFIIINMSISYNLTNIYNQILDLKLHKVTNIDNEYFFDANDKTGFVHISKLN